MLDTSKVKVQDSSMMHECPDCSMKFLTVGPNAAHARVYIHRKKIHGVVSTLSCFPACNYKAKV